MGRRGPHNCSEQEPQGHPVQWPAASVSNRGRYRAGKLNRPGTIAGRTGRETFDGDTIPAARNGSKAKPLNS